MFHKNTPYGEQPDWKAATFPPVISWISALNAGFLATIEKPPRYLQGSQWREMRMKKTVAILATVATVGATTMTAPAQARGIGPGLAFGLAAGALVAGAAGAYGPYGYGYGPGYGYYGPRYYAPAYGPYAYYRGYYPHYRYYHHWRRW